MPQYTFKIRQIQSLCSILIISPENYQIELILVNLLLNIDTSFFTNYFFSIFTADLGGIIGLWLGGSLLTLFEIIDIIGTILFRNKPINK